MGVAIPHVESATVTRTAAGSGDTDSIAPRVESAQSTSPAYDWGRLERAVGVLVAKHEASRAELLALRGELGDREHRIRKLEAQLLGANQRLKDTCKRIDELISQLDQLDAQLANTEPTA